MKKLLISAFAAAVILLFGGVNEVNGDPLEYDIEGETVAVVGCDKNASGALVIPPSYNGKPVISIGSYAFNSCSSLSSVTIPDSVTSIRQDAFWDCSNLMSVIIGNKVTSIGRWAFKDCRNLTNITIPDSVTQIGSRAFSGCSSLTSITFLGNAPVTGVNLFSWVSGNAKIFVIPGATGFAGTFAGLPVVIEANTAIYLDDEYSNGKDIIKTESAIVSLFTHFPEGKIFYTLDGTKPTFTSTPYTAPFQLTESVTIQAIAYAASFTKPVEAGPATLRILQAHLLSLGSAGGGTTNLGATDRLYPEGTEVTLTAKPEAGWQFISWSDDSTSSDATITITMDGPKLFKSIFGTNVTVNEIGAGKVIQTPSNPVPYGSTVTFTAKPDTGHYLFRWAGEQKGNDNPTQLQVTKPNLAVSALFAPSPVVDKIKINAVSKSDSPFTISFESKSGSTYTIEVSHNLKQWGEIGEVQGTGSSVEFTDLREALFQKQYYRLKLEE
ncbi:leucine-rich repeat protein [bacterium]|nr:leucine-rich repeat protein [bacterium]MDC0276914.1 leucine-rich repeat protein [bacterium]